MEQLSAFAQASETLEVARLVRRPSLVAERLCCKVWGRLRIAATGSGSSGDLKQLGDEGGLGPHVSSANIP